MTDTLARLLIIDDQPASVGLLLAYLDGQEIDIRVALDGRDGLQKALSGQPDLILLDVTMPMMDGFTVCEHLKADPRTAAIPVIFLSASIETADKLKGFAVGAVDYITKPFSEAEVLARVFVHLGQRVRLQRLDALTPPPAMQEARPSERDKAIFSRAVAELKARMSHPPSLPDLAHELGTNERKLTEIFRQHVGMTVFEFLLELRLERARLLLEEDGLQIQTIADRVGYRNAGDFTRAFRRRFSVGPREYRQARGLC